MYLIKIASSQGGLNKKGSETAPNAIIEALNDVYLSENGFEHKFIIDEAKIIENNIEETNSNIFNKAKEYLNKKCLFIGGDHSITYQVFKAFSEIHNEPGIIVFDAHPDCVNNFEPPSHEDWLKTLIEKGFVKPENVILVALRNIDKIEKGFLTKQKIKVFYAKNIANNIENVCDSLMELANKFGSLYISIDIDAIDPAFAPGTGYIEPAGLTSREIIYFIQRLKLLKNFKAADIVEVNPQKDLNNMTVKLAARLLAEFW